jgi:hypothetical protein
MGTKIHQISELSSILENKESLNENLIRLFGRFGLGRLLKQLSFKKEKGVSASDLILLSVSVPHKRSNCLVVRISIGGNCCIVYVAHLCRWKVTLHQTDYPGQGKL